MKKSILRAARFFGRNKPPVDVYRPSPYLPAYHPTLVVRKPRVLVGVAKVSGVGVLLVGAVVGYSSWRAVSDINQIYAIQKTSNQATEQPVQVNLKSDAQGKTNILLLGMAGAPNKAPDLTDVMTVLQVDRATKKTSYVVLPRKVIVQSPSPYFGEWQALNTVFSAGKYRHLGKADAKSNDPLAIQAGFAAIDKTVKDLTGIDIHYNLLIDYAAFGHAIDSIGGVTVSVPSRIVDGPLMKPYGRSRVVAARGEQTMTGRQALVYIRTFAGSNETVREAQRLERQMQVVKAYVKKVSSAGMLKNPAGLSDMLASFGSSFYSDMKLAETVLASKVLLASDMRYSGFLAYDVSSAAAPFAKLKETKNDLLEPKAGKGNYTEVQSYIALRLNGTVPMGKEFAILE